MDPFSSRQFRVIARKSRESFSLTAWIPDEKVMRRVYRLGDTSRSIVLIAQLSILLTSGSASPKRVSGMVFGNDG
jgi:hypothetical protein